jgi:hypothetical protein
MSLPLIDEYVPISTASTPSGDVITEPAATPGGSLVRNSLVHEQNVIKIITIKEHDIDRNIFFIVLCL